MPASATISPFVGTYSAELGAHDEGAQRSDRRGLTREVFQT
ncbi:MAG: hypothetical protein QOJ63_3148 [Solirubrobacteraceae bacterium]|jgi:hypothetical protein|nr:hypothetical protein [Solirubrobacteraceae bacterium]